jgi:tetratricopeptide (TPR) repeat protein
MPESHVTDEVRSLFNVIGEILNAVAPPVFPHWQQTLEGLPDTDTVLGRARQIARELLLWAFQTSRGDDGTEGIHEELNRRLIQPGALWESRSTAVKRGSFMWGIGIYTTMYGPEIRLAAMAAGYLLHIGGDPCAEIIVRCQRIRDLEDLYGRGQYEEVVQVAEAILADDPDLHKVWMAKGLALAAQGDYEAAVECYEQVLALGRDEASAHYNIACAECLAGHEERAAQELRQAIHAQPDFQVKAAGDDDFASVRSHPWFQELVP